MDYYVEVQHVQKKIDDFQLGPINLTIEPGTITALVGDNGSGKSTLLKMIMNLVNKDTGKMNVFGFNSNEEDWKQHVAYQPQTIIGYDAFTGKDLQTLISKWYPNWDQKFFIKLTNELQVPLDKKFGKLSQGVQQKLTLALTISRNAKLLILDEPTTFMDIPSKKLMTDLLVEWMEADDRSIILTSHQAEDIKKLADYIVLLRKGVLVGHFEKDALLESFRKYWLKQSSKSGNIPGVVHQIGHELISNQPELTESYLRKNGLTIINNSAIDLEEIITLVLTNKIHI